MSIQQVRTQNSLLQQLVLTLQRQLHTKNQQRKIIIETIDKLANENDTIHRRYVQLMGQNCRLMEKSRQQQKAIGELQNIMGNMQCELRRNDQQLTKLQQLNINKDTLLQQINNIQIPQSQHQSNQSSQQQSLNQLIYKDNCLNNVINEPNNMLIQQPAGNSQNSKLTSDQSSQSKCNGNNKTTLTIKSQSQMDFQMFKLLQAQHTQLQSQFEKYKILRNEQYQTLLNQVKLKTQQIDYLNQTVQTLNKLVRQQQLSRNDKNQQSKQQQQQQQQQQVDKQKDQLQQQQLENNHNSSQQLPLTQSTAINYLRQSLGHLGLDIDFTTIVQHIGLKVTQTDRQRMKNGGIEDDLVIVSEEIKQIQGLQVDTNDYNDKQLITDILGDNHQITNKRMIYSSYMSQGGDKKDSDSNNNNKYNNIININHPHQQHSSSSHLQQLSPRHLSPILLKRPYDEQKMRSSNDSNNQCAQIVVYYQQQLAKLRQQLAKVLQERQCKEEVVILKGQVNTMQEEENEEQLRINSSVCEQREVGQQQRINLMEKELRYKHENEITQIPIQLRMENQLMRDQYHQQQQSISTAQLPLPFSHQHQNQLTLLKATITTLTQQLSHQHADAKQRQLYITEIEQQLDSMDIQYNSQLMMLKKVIAEMNSELIMVKKQLFAYQKDKCGDLGKFIRDNFMSKGTAERVGNSQRTMMRNNSSLRTFFYQANGIDPKIITSNTNNTNNKSQQFIPSTYNTNNDNNNKSNNDKDNNDNNNKSNNQSDTTPIGIRKQATKPNRNNLTQYIYTQNNNKSRIKSYLSNQQEELDDMYSKSFNMGEMFMGRNVKPSRRAINRKFNTEKYSSLAEIFRSSNNHNSNSPSYSISPHAYYDNKARDYSPQHPQQHYSSNNLIKANTILFPQTNNPQYKRLIEQIQS